MKNITIGILILLTILLAETHGIIAICTGLLALYIIYKEEIYECIRKNTKLFK